ncbi:MAG: MFS transporter [Desulfotomaculaceae bacterium]|nr:MFS transporter [Desulfotomaculaceae bacterium]
MLSLLGTGHAITDIGQGALPMILAYLQPVLLLSQLQVGIVMLAFTLSSSIVQPVFGVLSDRFRAVWLIPLGCLLAGMGIAITGFSPNYNFLLAAGLLSGLGVAAYHPEGSKFARFASGARKASGMSLYSVGGNLGFAMGPVLVTWFFALSGLQGTWYFLPLNAVMALLLMANLASISGLQKRDIEPAAQKGLHNSGKGLPVSSLPSVVVPVVLLVLLVVMRSWVHLGLVTYLPQYYIHHLHQSEVYAATLVSVFLFAGVLGTLAGGPAADRWGLKTVIVGSMASMIPFLYLFQYVSGIWLLLLVALAGFIVVSTFAVTVVLAQELLPNHVGFASGLILGFAIGLGGVGTTLLGWVADHWGFSAVFQTMIIFPVVGLLIAIFLPGREQLSRRQAMP